MLKKSVVVLLVFASVESWANGWGVIGAGNASCANWEGNASLRVEVLSWMAGFSSAVNLEFAEKNEPEYRLELLTYDYLTSQINKVCSDKKNSGMSMSSILFGVLADFPREKSK